MAPSAPSARAADPRHAFAKAIAAACAFALLAIVRLPALAAEAVAGRSIGMLDAPVAETIVGPEIRVAGWALDPSGIAGVEVRIDELRFAAATGVARPDVALVHPGYPDSARAGYELTIDLGPFSTSADRRSLTIVAIGKSGSESVLARRSVIERAALTRWEGVARPESRTFHLLPALSGLQFGAAAGLEAEYAAIASSTVRVGMRVPILYLRTTKGAAEDYAFDPDWDVSRRCGGQRMADDSLASTLSYAATKGLPLLVTLNGGIWADSGCDAPAWDINDKLEQDAANCQWNEKNQVMPDDVLKNLPGSHASPELGRSLTFNVYALEVRRYKKRNLQQAARPIVAFMKEYPTLMVGVTLDPDLYINPFFDGQQWYDYNPGTLKQFREWLGGTGPYAGSRGAGVPDLSRYRRAKPLTIVDAGKLAGRTFRSWDEVDPPREFPRDGQRVFWNDPWVHEWEMFRRHLVALHYDELTQWLVEAGVPRDRIWSAQGFFSPSGGAMPFAIAIDSPVKNYDTAGVTVQGAKPPLGHLGAIVYGAAALNDLRMENSRTLFATLKDVDPAFAIVEFNTADLSRPRVLADYAAGYRALREMWNAGASFASPMAWNGSSGLDAGRADFKSYTAWRNTPLEDAARDFMLARAGLPLGSLLYTFGSARHADSDGWTVEAGTMAVTKGALVVAPDAEGRIVLVSPTGLALPARQLRRMVVGLPAVAKVKQAIVHVADHAGPQWKRVMDKQAASLIPTPAGRAISDPDATPVAVIDRVKVELVFDAPAAAFAISRIAILP